MVMPRRRLLTGPDSVRCRATAGRLAASGSGWVMTVFIVLGAGGWTAPPLAGGQTPVEQTATERTAPEQPLTLTARENQYYRLVDIAVARAGTDSRSANWKPGDLPDGAPVLEVSGLETLPDRRLAVAIRKGEVWLIDGAYDEPVERLQFHRFATALHEPLGLLIDGDELLTVQRGELTGLSDTDGDGVADRYRTVAGGWGLSGHYHEYAYGPKRDGDGNLWITLNIGMAGGNDAVVNRITDPQLGYRQAPWRGWGLRLDRSGQLQPICAGMRSPSGLGANAAGDMFYTDQQGNWVATNSLHQMRQGGFSHHPESLASMQLPGSTIHDVPAVPSGLPYPQAIAQFPLLQPPAVWLPYKKVGQSPTDILLDASDGRFGPFAGQLLIGEFTLAGINRVFLERVNGQYQGACFPFRSGLASAVLRLAQGDDGSVFCGLSNRGWSSLGSASYGLQRLVWTGQTPPEILEMRALRDGFQLRFTVPVDRQSAADVASYDLSSYTYLYQSSYGSDEIDRQQLTIRSAVVSDDALSVRLTVDGLRPLYVHELVAAGVRTAEGQPLLHPDAYYTLNQIPR